MSRAPLLPGLCQWLSGLILLLPLAAQAGCGPWQEWVAFKQHYLSAEGRVIDVGSPDQRTVSEGQAYALFFALVANDRPAFAQLLQWTENNLAAGDLSARLPAWLWGRRADGGWGVLDPNPASDADLWIAYTLGEAGRLWRERPLRVRGALVGQRIIAEETADLPGLGRSLLPAPAGFHTPPDRWRLNPSYAPLQLLRGLAVQQPRAGWLELLGPTERLLRESAPQGLAPDWVAYRAGGGFEPDSETQARGSYDAIRVYLWAGMLHEQDPARATLLAHLRPMAALTRQRGTPPEVVDSRSGQAQARDGNPGFSAALLPFLSALDEPALLEAQRQRLAAEPPARQTAAYYQAVLALFGEGWLQGRYRFGADGRLELGSRSGCAVSPASSR
jgi:endoglucanase